MHLHVIVCFALLIWWPNPRPINPIVQSPLWSSVIVWSAVPLFWIAAAMTSSAALRKLRTGSAGSAAAQHLYHRGTMLLRLAVVLVFMAVMFLTQWMEVVRSVSALTAIPGLAGLVVLGPLLASSVVLFIGLFPIDRAIHQAILDHRTWNDAAPTASAWTLRQYLNFNIRHHLLIVVVPMTIILLAFDLAAAHERFLVNTFGFPWAAEAAPGLAAAIVFVLAPLMLRHIWTTHSLPDGPLRQDLLRICDRIGMRCRDILVWKSGGLMVNAAVMGLFPRVRYVLLSDGLLDSMTSAQVEAVFGHEAGHVRHRHIPYFLLFAFCSMLCLSAVVEGLRVAVERELLDLSVLAIQGIAVAVAGVIWAVLFGWVSRRFERQADVFGAWCVTPPEGGDCPLPCSVHDPEAAQPPHAVCATAAGVFVSALDRVAVLNGIPREERSWRHSSIASRVRFLTSLTGDPGRARRFHRVVSRIKLTLLGVSAVGMMIWFLYVWRHPLYGINAPAWNRTTRSAAVLGTPMHTHQRNASHARADH